MSARTAGQMLRDLRTRAGLSTTQAAEICGLSQSKVSRVETGKLRLHDDVLDVLATAYGATRAEREELRRLRDADDDPLPRLQLSRDIARLADRLTPRLADVATRRTFAPTRIPGPLQTADYARADGVRAASRLDDLPTPSLRRAVYVLTEGAVRWSVAGPDVMAAQLRHLADRAEADDAAAVGVVPSGTRVGLSPRHGWTIFGSAIVVCDFEMAACAMDDPRDVETFERLFDTVGRAASYGKDAAAVFRRIADEF